jgi:hypothetical protein
MPKDFIVNRTNLREFNVVDCAPLSPRDGEAVISIDRFALTANNITYGVAGDSVGYWQFFPAPEGMGKIPVWGIGTVSASNHPNVEPGQRFYGYFPMSSELLVVPDRVSPRGFSDSVAHRAELPVVYNQYSLMNIENGFDPRFNNHQILYRPLLVTSYVLSDYLQDNDNFDANQIVISSASSKTAFGLAFMLKGQTNATVIGLTSPGNVDFVKELGLYDETVAYDDVEQLNRTEPTTYVDMSGNRQLRPRVHHHFGDNLVYDCGVGMTDWESPDGEDPTTLPGAKPTMFFAPTQIVKRNKELGPAEYQARIAGALARFYGEVDSWIKIEEHAFDEVEVVYREVLEGPAPDRGYIVTLS